ncbi:MAG: Mur ligase domain-containing protein [Patescibacteria group bacterium]
MDKKTVHFIGIGGIGVSALARYYLAKNWQVFGSDLANSEITDALQSEGVKIFIGQRTGNVNSNLDLVIFTLAVKEDNPELHEARKLNIPTISYAEALGELTKQYVTIAVSGSHGKSTTTALLSLMLIKAGLDPTVIVGTRLKEFKGSNFRLGKSRYLVIEADEWNRSFWHYHPAIAVITNVDKEHLDTYKDLSGVISGFNHYLKNIPTGAAAIINAQDKNSVQSAKGCKCQLILFNKKSVQLKWPLKIYGHFNQLNAEAAWQAVKLLGVKKNTAAEAISKFQGSWRRMEQLSAPSLLTKGEKISGTFFSDYAHHPNEIKATISALKEKYPKKKLLVIFQPHQIERLNNLFNDFVLAFDETDELGILPVYEVAGRERDNSISKTAEDLYKALLKRRNDKPTFYLKNFTEVFKLIHGQAVVFMGAGDIDKEARKYFQSKLLR